MSCHNGTGAGPKSDTMGGAEKLAPPLARFPHGAGEQPYYEVSSVVPVEGGSARKPRQRRPQIKRQSRVQSLASRRCELLEVTSFVE